MVVIGGIIGSGIFINPYLVARLLDTPALVLAAWIVGGAVALAGAFAYAELGQPMPRAGGQYIYLREAYSPLWGFLYGWTLFLVIQTGTIAAVAVAFSRYLGVLLPGVSPNSWIIPPINLSDHYAVSLSTQQLVRQHARAADW